MTRNEIANDRKAIGLMSIKYSAVDRGSWEDTKEHVTGLLKKQNLDVFILVRIFGRDEIWIVFTYTSLRNIQEIEKEDYVIGTAFLHKSMPFDEKTMENIIGKKLPVGYLFFRKRMIALEDIRTSIENAGGKHFLIGAIDHPAGFSHCVILTVESGDIPELNEVVYSIVKSVGCKEWECALGAKHGWPRGKPKGGYVIGEIIKDWIEGAKKGELSDWEIEQIESKFGIRLPKPKKQQ